MDSKENKKTDAASEQNEENLVFFKVMPKIKKGTMVMPDIKSVLTKQPEEKAAEKTETDKPIAVLDSQTSQPKASFFSRFKYYLIVLIVLIVGAAAYFFLPKFFVEDYKSQNILVAPGSNSAVKADPKKQEWLKNYFLKVDCDKTVCGDQADPDSDGLTNAQEYELKTDPNNSDSDKDGLSDGDEVNVLGSDPLNDHSGVNQSYFDQDYAKGAYNFKTDKPYTPDELKQITLNIKKFGIHEPTIKTLGEVLVKVYKYTPSTGSQTASSSTPSLKNATSTPLSATSTPETASSTDTTDFSPEAKQDRDTQRSLTIKNLGIALVKYSDDNKIYPDTNDFVEMFNLVKPYIKVATDPHDPLNFEKYIYSYSVTPDKADFTLSYYSETLSQVIKKNSKNAKEDLQKEQAAVFNDQRRRDLDSLRSTLLVYSDDNVAGNQNYVFPTKDKYKTALVPKYISSIPKDPKTSQDYDYQVSLTFDTFTLKAVYDLPPTGKTGYLCNQEECRDY